MRKIEIAVILILCAVLVGCGTAFHVTRGQQCNGKGGECKGVPFYTKIVACNHETVWLEPTYILTLVGTQKPATQKPEGNQPEGQKIVIFNLTKEISQYDLSSDQKFKAKVQEFIERVINQNPEGSDAAAILYAFNGLPEYTLPLDKENKLQKGRLTLGSNRNEMYTFVDYSVTYYFNADIPFSGSVNPEINLGPDLTLSKASVNVTEETFKTSMGVLSSAATGVLAGLVAPPPTAEVKKAPTPVLLQLNDRTASLSVYVVNTA